MLKNVDVKMAYKFYDVVTKYTSGKKVKPLIPKNRFFTNVSYISKHLSNGGHWKVDATYNWLNKQRFPNTSSNPQPYQLSEYSPNISTLNAQITRVFSNAFEIYVGGENLTNTKQNNPVISAEDPFGPYFDTTMVYGPIFGSMYYAGLRYKLN